MSARSVRAGTSAVGIVLAAGVLVAVNYLSARHWARFDWTKTRIYSVSDQTKKILAGLKAPVRVTVFMTGEARLYQPVRELLSRYQALSPKIEVEYLDPRRNIARAEALVKEFGVRQNTVVFRSGDRKKYVEEDKLAEFDYTGMQMGGGSPTIKAFKGEEAFTSAILAVSEERQPKVVFTKGHGEAALDSSERGRGYSEAKQLLERDNMTVSTWESLGKEDLPADADVVVVAGPRTAFLPPEAGALEKHLEGGGHALILLDPILPGPGAPPADFGLGGLVTKYGLKLGNDIVVDPANALPLVGAETVLANKYGTQAIVRPLSSEGLPVIFPLARSVTKAEKAPDGLIEDMLVETSADGWGETKLADLANGGQIQKEAGDTPGPVSLAVSVGPSDARKPGVKAPRLVVIGNSRFAGNGSLSNGGNGILFANAVHWLAGSEKQIGIAPKTIEQASLSLTDSQVRRIGILSVAVLPGLAVLLGIWVWYRRRD